MIFSSATILMIIGLTVGLVQSEPANNPSGLRESASSNSIPKVNLGSSAIYIEPLEFAASDQSSFTTSSHKIIASGWPSTSPMWPSIDTADNQAIDTMVANSSRLSNTVEPFIYADKPRDIDYSLLLNINKTIAEILKSRIKPVAVNLSFEYYFNHGPKITALPGIKIEVDRKEFRYLEPASSNIKARIWMKFNEQITINDPSQFDNHDWLKFSLVNRRSPSLVAIRHLRVEFLMGDTSNQQSVVPQNLPPSPIPSSSPSSDVQQVPVMSPQNLQVPPAPSTLPTLQEQQVSNLAPQSLAPTKVEAQQPQLEPPVNPSIPQAPSPSTKFPTNSVNDISSPARDAQQPAFDPDRRQPLPESNQIPAAPSPDSPNVEPVEPDVPNQQPAAPGSPSQRPFDQQTAASSIVMTQIKPVTPKKSSTWKPTIFTGRRKKRDISTAVANNTPSSIVLTCFRSDDCEWKTDSNENIQWSLARMPPSTQVVQSGYFYVSNRNNYGDLSKMLRITLNQTDSATIADQNSDHCIELALYVTERARLNLFKMTKTNDASDDNPDSWQRGSLLLSWSPTLAVDVVLNDKMTVRRSSLPNSKLFSMGAGQSGWTMETLCFGDFFGGSPKDCGAGRCAFGFEMEIDGSKQSLALPAGLMYMQQGQQVADLSSMVITDLSSSSSDNLVEQVVGISLLNEHSVNIPLRQNKHRWLETWQRDEVLPTDNWKFYPKMDYVIESNQVRLLNLYDGAQYFMESDWVKIDEHLDLMATLVVSMSANNITNITRADEYQRIDSNTDDINIFSLKTVSELVNSRYEQIFASNSSIEWRESDIRNLTLFNLGFSISDRIKSGWLGQLRQDGGDDLFKISLKFQLDTQWLKPNSIADRFLKLNGISFNLTVANVSISDRCHPSPCQYGVCQQNGTGYEDWNCACDDRHQGRRCEYGRWCDIPHVTPWILSLVNGKDHHLVTIKTPNQQQQQLQRHSKSAFESVTRVTGREYCQRKLGPGFKCTNIDLPLNDNLYTEEDKTFFCTCQDDFYLSDDSKCKQAHLCNSIVCPAIGMICDETKPFNRTQPCQCNEKQDWHEDPNNPNKCIRRQCHDKQRDCGFDAHICLPTLPGERPICKCGPNFTLKVNEKGQKYCQSTACILPTLNDCEHVCIPDKSNLQRPYNCSCHPGYTLEPDGRSCKPKKVNQANLCRPSCNADTQICTELGCKCKQGFIGESEIIEQQVPKNRQILSNSSTTINYVKSVRCLNVCSLSYAENKAEFDMIESVCPLGLCDPGNFHCRCADPSSSALINTKYEPVNSNTSDSTDTDKQISPLCHLRRVCQAESSSYQICKSQGAICVPDYTKAAMFDCICPPSTEKKFYGSATSGEFTCEPKCGSKKYDCLRKQAVCKLIDHDQVKCECLPGLMFDEHDQRCYLASYTYSFNLLVVNRYYEPESRFHKLEQVKNSTEMANHELHEGIIKSGEDTSDLEDKTQIMEILPQYSKAQRPALKSIFIADYNQCNITQVIPKDVIEDPYEHDIESFLGYIEQCNERLHQTARTYHLNSKLGEDVRRSLRQHLRDFTVTTSNSSCVEIDPSGMYLNCTIYLQSNEQIAQATIESVFNECDRHGQDDRFCWVKPRLLLKKPQVASMASGSHNGANLTAQTEQLSFRQVVPCEIDNFCGLDAYSVRHDDKSSLCSCKCPPDIEVIDVKDLEQRRRDVDTSKVSVKEVCAPRNLCGANSTFCQIKTGSVCHYDVRLGSRCNCVYPSYEDALGQCVEVAFNPFHNYLIVAIILLATCLLVSIAINLVALYKSKRLFGRSKQYPLNEFTTTRSTNLNRSTGVPNLSFTSDD